MHNSLRGKVQDLQGYCLDFHKQNKELNIQVQAQSSQPEEAKSAELQQKQQYEQSLKDQELRFENHLTKVNSKNATREAKSFARNESLLKKWGDSLAECNLVEQNLRKEKARSAHLETKLSLMEEKYNFKENKI